MTDLVLDPARAALLVVDVQERLHPAIGESMRVAVEKNVPILIEIARQFALPVVASEQYPKGLGATIPVVAEALAQLDPPAQCYDKLAFSACEAEPFTAIWGDVDRDQWIVVGVESHVCVYQTVRSLRARGAAVHVPRDGVGSRTEANRDVGLGLMERAGAVITSTEVILFDLLQSAGGERFKALTRLIR